jgi:hypothetical protein
VEALALRGDPGAAAAHLERRILPVLGRTLRPPAEPSRTISPPSSAKNGARGSRQRSALVHRVGEEEATWSSEQPESAEDRDGHDGERHRSLAEIGFPLRRRRASPAHDLWQRYCDAAYREPARGAHVADLPKDRA